jgi:hypothetical protein
MGSDGTVGAAIDAQAFFSILRWRQDPTRDEARNVAVVLADRVGRLGGIRAAPLSTISPRLHDQGLLDSMLLGLQKRFDSQQKPTAHEISELHRSMQQSLYFTEPQPVSVADEDVTLSALYKTYVAPRSSGRSALTKGAILDKTIAAFRRQGFDVRRGQYVGDFIFDAVIRRPQQSVIDVLSFATNVKDWSRVEHEAAHFVYALERLDTKGLAVVQPPVEESANGATKSYRRVAGWLKDADIRILTPQRMTREELSEQLLLGTAR